MRRTSSLVRAAVVAVTALLPASVHGQVLLSVYGVAGYNSMDVEGWYGGSLVDWTQFTSGGMAQALFDVPSIGLQIGGEVGYQYMLSYDYPYFNGTSTYPITRDVDATRVVAIARAPLGEDIAFSEFGAGLFLFDGFTDLAVSGALGVQVPVGERLSIPIKARAEILFDSDGRMVPLTLNAGLSYRVGG